MKMSYKIAILKSESAFDHEPWVMACEASKDVDFYKVIDLTANDWLSQATKDNFHLYLLRPPGRTERFKQLYDERVFLLTKVLQKNIYPSLQEVLIYENKRFLRDWLSCRELPHPVTFVYYNYEEAQRFIDNRKQLPIVGKTNIGASGNGVRILNTRQDAVKYIKDTFSEGIKQKSGPKIFKGSLLKKVKKLSKKGFLSNRIKEYKVSAQTSQKGFVILQEFVPHDFEWRCVRIGESFFAHKKIVKNNMSSGTLLKGYETVPMALLDFVRQITDQTNLLSVAIDLFETGKNTYLINEVQCFFGQSDPYQMLVDGKPGRYVFQDNQWLFEEGMFNTNQSYDLRLAHALSLLKNADH